MLKEEYVWIPKVVWAIADVLIMYQLFPLFFQALQAWGIFSCFTEYASYRQREKTFLSDFALLTPPLRPLALGTFDDIVVVRRDFHA